MCDSFRALGDARLMGLLVPKRLGGLEQGLLSLAVLTEVLGQSCASTAICYGMHCVGTAVIAAKATPHQAESLLRPIARGKHITTLALSETGTGSHFYLPETSFRREQDDFVIDGEKVFVTNGGHADSYVVTTAPSTDSTSVGEFSCFIVNAACAGITWSGDWHGLGIRGNSSRALRLDHVRVPAGNLLGEEGEQIWYVFEIVAPYFLMAMSGTYLGVAQAALDLTLQHVSLAPMIGTNWSMTSVDNDAIAGLLAESIRSAQQSRKHRTTLDRVNLHISPDTFRGGGDYRKLILSDRYLRCVLDQAQDAILGADSRAVISSINHAAALLFGCTEADAVGSSLLRLCGGEWEGRLSHVLADLRSGVAPSLEEVKCVRLTAYARSEDRIKAVSAGFLMHVAKPVEPLELITMVAAATGRT